MLYIVIGAVAVVLLVLVVVALGMRSSGRNRSEPQRDRSGRAHRTDDWGDSDDYDDNYWQRLAADEGGFGGSLSRRRAAEPPSQPAAAPAAKAPARAAAAPTASEEKTETMARPSPAEILRAARHEEKPSRPDPLSDPLPQGSVHEPVTIHEPGRAPYEPERPAYQPERTPYEPAPVAAALDPLTDPSYAAQRDPLTDPAYAVHRDPLTDPSYNVASDPMTTGGSWAASTPAPASPAPPDSYGSYQVQPGWSSIQFDAGTPAAQPAPAYPDPVQSTYSLPEPGNDPLFGRYPGTYSEPLSDWATSGSHSAQPARNDRVTSELPDYYR